MRVDVLIIGQGLCGTFLCRELEKEGKTFFVIDNAADNSASKTAAGVINPVTGRRYAATWMIENLLNYAVIAYTDLSHQLHQPWLRKMSVIDFFPTPQMLNAFTERVTQNDTYLHPYPDQNRFNSVFNYDFGCGEISPAYVADVAGLLKAWRYRLQQQNLLWEIGFNEQTLSVNRDGIRYETIDAQHIIFCDGIAAASNAYFSRLPFAASKGEALQIVCADLPRDHVFKRGLTLVPLAEPGRFWVGSSYQWEFEDDKPTEAFYNASVAVLNTWLKVPYKIVAHKAALRPSTLERRPFAGFHPQHTNVGILNGMGTKGASLAPFFAHQLVQHLCHQLPITPEADVRRFSRILSR